MAEQNRRIVFFLGAGASLGAGATATVEGGGHIKIPTQVDFWETFLRFCQNKKNRTLIEGFLFRYFRGYTRIPTRANAAARRRILKDIDVEEVFTFLSERINAPETLPQLRTRLRSVWDAMINEFCNVFSRFPANSKTKSIYQRLHAQHIRARDTVVSFNYDTVFEDSLAKRVNWYYAGIDSSHTNGALRIIKPHGSINWDDYDKIKRTRSPDRPVIVAPTHLKFVGAIQAASRDDKAEVPIGYINSSVSKVWASMEQQMREAKALVFIGYSFPVADLYFSSVLRTVLTARDTDPSLVVVNPDAIAIGNRLRSRFSVDKIIPYFDLATFAQVSRRQLLDSFRSVK